MVKTLKLTDPLRGQWFLTLHILVAVAAYGGRPLAHQSNTLFWIPLSKRCTGQCCQEQKFKVEHQKNHQNHRACFQGCWESMQLIENRQECHCLNQVKLQFRHPDLKKGAHTNESIYWQRDYRSRVGVGRSAVVQQHVVPTKLHNFWIEFMA